MKIQTLKYSFIIPVYNRPDEIRELLESLCKQTYEGTFEVVIIEDGSDISSKEEIEKFQSELSISYFSKENSGPGDSRNYGMKRAKGNYFIILDSDCILPEHYLEAVNSFLLRKYVDCFGGSDNALDTFTNLQKAINYTMTSFLTTGGIRGGNKTIQKFEPRSFNMGLSKRAFELTNGFRNIHPGEDPDLTIRLWKKEFETAYIEDAFVYHKRRISWWKFYKQVNKFGQTRPILNYWHPETRKITFWLPFFFTLGLFLSIISCFFGRFEGLYIYASYFILLGMHSARINKSFKVGFFSIWAVCIQFVGYGIGFIRSTTKLWLRKENPQTLFPHLFFTIKKS